MDAIKRISKEALKEHLADAETMIIDVRLNWTTSQKMIRNAHHEDPDQVPNWQDHYAKDKTIVLYCSTPEEKTSTEVAAQLIEAGFKDVCVLRGGWIVWKSADFPMHDKRSDTRPQGVVTGILNT
ncbi:MAG: rhodanese-related (seleno)protein [Desulfobacterales bacterium]|nr:rhodanese-related (seleno)protein [Desulfobacterales bacterium]MDJ0913620.1 rhodanese-related (seleno)protein [Desulfobacterales bacterium]